MPADIDLLVVGGTGNAGLAPDRRAGTLTFREWLRAGVGGRP